MKEKSVGIDILRILSMICVVLLHSVSNGLRFNFDTNTWKCINILSSFATSAVPIFFMISGFLILESKNTYSIKYTIFNRLPRLIIPLFVWSVIYIVVSANMDFYNRNIPLNVEDIWNNIFMFLQSERAVHFWFMYYLIPLYLIAPFIKAACDNSRDKIIWYFLILWGIVLVLNVAGKFASDRYKPLFDIAFIKNMGLAGSYGGYFILGWFLGKKDFKINKLICVISAIVLTFIIAKGTSYFTFITGEYDEWIKSYNSIFVCLLSVSLFLLFKDIKIKFGYGIIKLLGGVSYGVYLCHNIFLYLVTELDLGRITGHEMARNFICVSIISVVLIFILSQIKYINFIFTGKN
ncbi:MAG: acyltransferase [Lachnospirales bacterium]